ncbi:hypothetical protein F0562_012679 [Nyssa sinensis]|uniref:Chromo domain-containing protein n=1 Tax=Nyssa sinensis TaxID=561372 RepID=A0A5J4ZY90_9ASTE|nr:hypothetical protein F0562_012679 [Nyssa sinensis]
MDSRVEKLEADVNSLTIGQQQILDKLNELSVQFNTRAGSQPTNGQPDLEGENSQAPLQNPNRQMGGTSGTSQQGSHYAPRFVKLDFPRFKGEEDTTSWFCRVNQFFEFNHTPEEDRVALASFHLEGDAQLWYQLLKQEKGVGSIRDYQTQFEKLLAKVGYLPPNRQVSCFISGLKESIKADVLAGCPATLSTAIGLARLYEARNTSQRRPTITADLRKNYFPQQEGKNSNTTLPVRRLSPTELQERRVKGLCYNCNEKFVPGHRCKKLFLIELCEAEGDGDVVMEEEDTEQTSLNDRPEISLHAISGSRAPETMRVRGTIGRISTTVLVDSGSTHNFISEVLAKKVGLQPIQGGQFEVMVASGERLSSQGKCKGVKLLLQGIPVSADFYLLPLEGYDIVLGTQWLQTLGPILWDFAKLQMKFKVAEAEVTLQGESCPADQIVGELKFIKEARKGYKGMLFQLFSLDSSKLSQEEQYQSSHLQQLLEKFQDVFEEPNNLPPSGTHDHKIRDQVLKDLRVTLQESQSRMKKIYDQHRTEREFEVGDWVYLKLQPYRQTSVAIRKAAKLAPKYYGPFMILKKIGAVSYKLELPTESKIHPVFHVSLLKKKVSSKHPIQGELPAVVMDTGTIFPIPQAVLDRRQRSYEDEILIHWKGLSPAEATWENLAAMQKQFPNHSLEDKADF